jgi:outer membrane protein TolC
VHHTIENQHFTYPKESHKALIVCILVGLTFLNSVSQVPQPGDNSLRRSSLSGFSLPPLDTLIQSALANSGGYRYFSEEIKVKQEELRLQNKNWFDYINIDGDVGYGHNDQLFFNQYSYNHEYSLLSNSKQMRYYTGLSLKVPLSAFLNRNNNLKIAHHNVNKAEGEARKTEEQITSAVIELYFATLSNYKAMVVGQAQLETALMEMEKSEKDFTDGVITLNSYSVTVRNYYKEEIENEKAKNDFIECLTKLELITGIGLTRNLR